ncbi:MAG: fibronectin type III domain-containing protein [Balneola sp.]|jgi:hypothetical protein
MINRLIILCISFTCVLGCSTGPDFKRDNVSDPKSRNFEPHLGNLIVSIDSAKNVHLNWNDLSDFEDGFIIQKSYAADALFFNLDTVRSNVRQYIDESKSLTTNTYYRIRSYSDASDSLGSTEIDKLIFQPLNKLIAPDVYGNTVLINLEKDSSSYLDFYKIEKRTNSNDWVTLDTLSSKNLQYEYTETENIYFNSIRVSTLLLNYKNEFEVIATYQVPNIGLNLPSNFKVDLKNEALAEFSWSDNSIFDDGFIILQKSKDSETYIPLDTVFNANRVELLISYSSSANYHFSIIPIFNNTIGKNIGLLSKDIFSVPPKNFKLQHISESSAEIYWRDGNINRPNYGHYNTFSFYLEVFENKLSYELVDTIEANRNSYKVTNLNPQNEYQFRMRTYSSYYSDPLNIASFLSLKKNYETTFQDLESFEIDRDKKSFRVTRFKTPREIEIYTEDFTSLKSYSIQNGEILEIESSKTKNLISLNHFFGSRDSSKIIVYDFSLKAPKIDSLLYNSDNNVHILRFESDQFLFISEYIHSERRGNILKWDIEKETVDTLYNFKCFCYEHQVPKSLTFDAINQQYYVGLNQSLLILDTNGNLKEELLVGGTPTKIQQLGNSIYFKLHNTKIGSLNLIDKKYEFLYSGFNVSDFIVIESLNYLVVADFSSFIPFKTKFTFYELNTHKYLFEIERENKIYGMLYNENNNSLNVISNIGIEVFDFKDIWEIKK